MAANTTRRKHRRRCLGAVALAFGLVTVFASAAGAGSAGQVSISAPNGSALTSGGSNTVFAVRTPDGAKCPGDTAHDAYFVNSYFVPDATAPTSVNFKGGLPDKGLGIISNGEYYGAVNTARDTGAIVTLPLDAKWDRLDHTTLFPNGMRSTVWQTGIACVDTNGVVKRYWNARLQFTVDAHDPRGFHWAVTGATPAGGGDHSAWLLAPALGLAAAGIVVIRGRRPARAAVGRAS